jgi:hypothetical protein
MEILACEQCNRIVCLYERSDRLMPLPEHKYMVAGQRCSRCSHQVFVRRWTFEYELREQNGTNTNHDQDDNSERKDF